MYKLVEIDKRFRVFKTGGVVLDLGASPGSWAAFASQRVGAKGAVVAVDIQPIRARLPPNVRAVEMDAARISDEDLASWGAPFCAVLSDMAPRTTGVRFADQARSLELARVALSVAVRSLTRGGAFVAKLFQSAESRGFEDEARRVFDEIRWVKPDASRAASWEIFMVGARFSGR